jgi:hypothetical protein
LDHGLSGTPLYAAWVGMHQRCSNPSGPNWKHYGGRGIRVCQRWNDLHAFLADMGHPEPNQTLGRIDNDGPYEPANCRWETQEQQNENTRRNRFLTWDGRTQILKHWAKEYDLAPRRLSERLKRGWSLERALTTPCPVGYEAGRAKHCAEARAMWAKNGHRYSATRKNPTPD